MGLASKLSSLVSNLRVYCQMNYSQELGLSFYIYFENFIMPILGVYDFLSTNYDHKKTMNSQAEPHVHPNIQGLGKSQPLIMASPI